MNSNYIEEEKERSSNNKHLENDHRKKKQNNKKNMMLNKIQRELHQHDSSQYTHSQQSFIEEPQSQKLYQKWKLKEKSRNISRNIQRSQVTQHTESESIINQKKLERHSPDHFYRKGLEFEQQHEVNCSKKFKEIYSFQPNTKDISMNLTEGDKEKLHQRLFKEKNYKEINSIQYQLRKMEGYGSRQGNNSHSNILPNASNYSSRKDLVKQKIKKRDEQIDRTLFKMIQEGIVKNKTEIKETSKSPFRKTICS